jgi:hypothetical protein
MKIDPNETSIQNFMDHLVHESHPQSHFAPFFKNGHLKEFKTLIIFTLALNVAA